MNTEDFVTYEQALSLKKLGFIEECLYYYDLEGRLCPNGINIGLFECVEDYKNKQPVYIDEGLHTENLLCPNIDICDAPTLAQAQGWLRKEKNYYVNPDADVSDCWLWEIVNLRNSDLVCMWNLSNQPNHYNSYEKALSAGITECLRILERRFKSDN